MSETKVQEHWSSRWFFMMAAVGSAVGLANIWRFPYTTGENGGGAFVFIYLAAVFFIALPLVIGEFLLGRRAQACPTEGMKNIIREAKASPLWAVFAYGGVLTTTLILSYYCMIGGETIVYAVKTISGEFTQTSVELTSQISNNYSGSWLTVLGGHSLFLGLTVFISSQGISKGVERAIKYMMPMLFIILLVMVGYAMKQGAFAQTLSYLFTPDFSRVTRDVVIDAFGQAFFSVSVGATTLMAYGSYMQRKDPLVSSAAFVVTADTIVAILAGLAIFPVVFAFGLDAGGGPGLVFETVPLAFGNMPGGSIVGALFFVLLAFAALTSSISILEVPVAWLNNKPNWTRKQAAILWGSIVWLLGLLPVLSFNELSGFYPLGMFGIEKTFFDLFDYIASNIMLPLSGLVMAIFVAWILPVDMLSSELGTHPKSFWFKIWYRLLGVIVPAVLIQVFLSLIL